MDQPHSPHLRSHDLNRSFVLVRDSGAIVEKARSAFSINCEPEIKRPAKRFGNTSQIVLLYTACVA
jgi:hypothetical protein